MTSERKGNLPEPSKRVQMSPSQEAWQPPKDGNFLTFGKRPPVADAHSAFGAATALYHVIQRRQRRIEDPSIPFLGGNKDYEDTVLRGAFEAVRSWNEHTGEVPHLGESEAMLLEPPRTNSFRFPSERKLPPNNDPQKP